MVGTRSTTTTDNPLKKILVQNFGLKEDSPILIAFAEEDIETVMDIFTLEQIETLQYSRHDPTTGQTTKSVISKGNEGWIKAFIEFARVSGLEYEEDFEGVDVRDFNKFRINQYNPYDKSTTTNNVTNRTMEYKDVEYFKKSIKRDKNQYITLRQDWQWDSWKRSTISTAKTHACEEIFDPEYVPSTKAEKELFIEKQKFIYCVFQDKLLTDMGKHLVQKYDGYAQKVYKELSEYTNKSTQARIESANLLGYITNVRLHKISWKGTYHSFILHWCDKVRLYEDLIPSGDQFTDNFKMAMLQNTVAGIKTLNSVKNTQEHDAARGKADLTYQSYLTLLLSTATTVDAERGFTLDRTARTYQPHKKLNINTMSQDYNDVSHENININELESGYHYNQHEHGFEEYNIDSGIIEEDIFAVHQSKSTMRTPSFNGPRMAKNK